MPPFDLNPLRKRAISALILAPLALAAAVAGMPLWNLLVALMGACMAWEWGRICGGRMGSAAPIASIIAAPVTILIGMAWGIPTALVVLAVSVLLVYAIAKGERFSLPGWLAAGVVYVGLPCLALEWIRIIPGYGLETLLWVLALVWATDTGAYVAGRAIGGPKLAPRISPNKTWAGLAGGSGAAMLVGLATAMIVSGTTPWFLILVSGALAIIEQVGDLFESGVKRRFGVKDSSNLIPGHGGVLDRVDGLLAVALAVAGLTWVAGRSILIWPEN